MHIPAIAKPAPSVPTDAAKPPVSERKPDVADPAGAKPSSGSDRLTISKAAKHALATDKATTDSSSASAATQAAARAADQALQAGKQLQQRNLAAFKQADANGNGKLSAEEAHAAGLTS